MAADVTTANVYDNQMYESMPSSLPNGIQYMIGDSGYYEHKLNELSIKRGFELVSPVQRYKHTPANRLELKEFYESELGQSIYSWKSKSIELLIEHFKSVFRIDPVKRISQSGCPSSPSSPSSPSISAAIPDNCLLQSQNQTL